MSIFSYTTLKTLARAYGLKTDRDVEMFDDLWEVYQVGGQYRRDHEALLREEVQRSYDALTRIIHNPTHPPTASGFQRIGRASNQKLVIFSDHHMTHRGHRHDYFFQFNYPLYCELLQRYADSGFALVENGDMEELVVFEPTPEETRRRRALVKKSVLEDIGKIDWEALVAVRIESRRKQLERILDDNRRYYDLVRQRFGRGRFYKISGNHDGYYSPAMEGLIEAALWPDVIKDILLLERPRDGGVRLEFAVMHGHQFDESCVPPHAKQVGEVISECLAWAFQGADRIWRVSDTHKWTRPPLQSFNNVLSRTRRSAPTTGHPDLEILLESFMGHEVAWEYFENRDPYQAFVKEVCTGEEFFKYRHLDENALANAILPWQSASQDFPTVICGHSHEPRDRARFENLRGLVPSGTGHPDVFTGYMNTGSAGRFENLIWCIEITDGIARVCSWSNSGTASHITPEKVCWRSDGRGKLIGQDAAATG